MEYQPIYTLGLWIIFGVSALSFPFLFFYTAPYGRYESKKLGPGLPYNLGWFIMELPTVLVFPYIFFKGEFAWSLTPIVILFIWMAHYTYRSIFYPFLLKGKGKKKSVAAVATGFIFNCINGFCIAYGLSHVETHFSPDWLLSWHFILGTILMGTGFYINFTSDKILRSLRKPGESGYKIPYGGMYKWVSSPNYLGEIIEWTGLAVMLWNLAGLAFMLFTIANLFPRAFSHHRWYLEKFDDYPKDRKAIIPYIA